MIYFYLAIGGVIGTVARYAVGSWVQSWVGGSLPWGTLAVNLIGCFVLGLVVRATQLSAVSPELRLFLTVGFCGAFTTFSTYSYETLLLAQAGAWGRAALYAFGSLALGLATLSLGFSVASLLIRPGAG